MTSLDREFLQRLFNEIDEEVKERIGEHVLIVGGAAPIFAGMERGTEDVDAVSQLSPGPLVNAIRRVGCRHNLRHDWFNDRTRHFTSEDFSLCEQRLVFQGRNIRILRPDLTYLLAMKLRSARQ